MDELSDRQRIILVNNIYLYKDAGYTATAWFTALAIYKHMFNEDIVVTNGILNEKILQIEEFILFFDKKF